MPKIRKWLKKRRYQPSFAIEKIAAAATPVGATAKFDVVSEQHLVPYDENLLECSRTQWQFGDWASLAAISRGTLQHHPDRAKLALLSVAGHQGLGNAAEARQYTQLAIDWGCSKKLVSQILIAGVHNTLGRAHLANGSHSKALSHIEDAICTGTSGACSNLFAQVQIRNGLDNISVSLKNYYQARITSSSTSDAKDVDCLSLKEECIRLNDIDLGKSNIPRQDLVDAQFDLDENNQTKNILVIFSTPRCGSTYLCNLLQVNGLCIPHEYFQLEQYLPILAKRWRCTSDKLLDCRKFVQSLCNKRTTQNGWFGINLHSHHIKTFEVFMKYFPTMVNYHLIHMVRDDVLGQAISWEIAEQTGRWNSYSENSSEPNYNFSSVGEKVKSINDGNFYIKTYIEKNKSNCTEITYENLVLDPELIISGIFPTIQSINIETTIKKQANEVNQMWRKRYQVDLFC